MMNCIIYRPLIALLLVGTAWCWYEPYATAQEASPAAADSARTVSAGPSLEHESESALAWFVRSSGLIGLFILGLSIYFVATVIRLFMDLRMSVAAPPEVLEACEEFIKQRDLKGLYDYARGNDSLFTRLLTVGLSELSNGLPDAKETMDRAGECEVVRMEKQISMLAVLGTLGPMIGLIGTLKGMISSFSVIAMSGAQLKANEVADGISEALLLTFEGVALSVPAIYFFAVFRNRVSSIMADTMFSADQLLRHAARTRGASLAPPAHSRPPQ